MKTNRSHILRSIVCVILALPLVGLSAPSAFGFWGNLLQGTGTEAAIATAATAETNSAPVASDVKAETYAEVYIEIPLSATDKDGDAVIFQLVEDPKHGIAAIDNSVLQYTPGNKTGNITMKYVAIDTMGNMSEPAEVKVKVRKNSAKLTYADMDSNRAHYAALQLSEAGVLTGEKIGASYFFHPGATVSRSEFITMVSAVARLPITETTETDFIDDAGISAWAKPYISAASRTGLISGYLSSAGKIEFRGESEITNAEASVIVGNLLSESLDLPVQAGAFEDESLPAWAAPAVTRLTAANVLPENAKNNPQEKISRQTACELLYQAMLILNA